MKKRITFILCFLLFPFFICAQNFNHLNSIVETEKITLEQVSFLVASYLDSEDESISLEQSFVKLSQMGYFLENDKPSDFITVKKLSGIYAKVFNIKGGIFYRLFKKSDRYAFKELMALGYFPDNVDPSDSVSGVDAIGLLNDMMGGDE